jgi:hypothetical protein
MKISKYLSAAVLAGAMLFANCNKDDESASPYRPADAVNITFSVRNASTPLTRSNPLSSDPEVQAKFNPGDKIQVSTTDQSPVTYTLQSNGAWTEDPVDGKPTYLLWKASEQTFTATYPASYNGNFTLPLDQSSPDLIAAADYMSVTSSITRPANKGTDITLTLERQTARLTVAITSYGNQYATDNQTVSAFKILGITPYQSTDADNHNTYTALINPGSVTDDDFANDFITLIDGDGNQKTVQKSSLPANFEFKKGKSYKMTLKVGKDVIKVGEVEVTDWTDDNAITGGKAEKAAPAGYIDLGITVGGKRIFFSTNPTATTTAWSDLTDAQKAALPTKDELDALCTQCHWVGVNCEFFIFKAHSDHTSQSGIADKSFQGNPYNKTTEDYLLLPSVAFDITQYYWSQSTDANGTPYALQTLTPNPGNPTFSVAATNASTTTHTLLLTVVRED